MSLRQFARRAWSGLSSHFPPGLLLAALLTTALLAGSCDVMPGANSGVDPSEPSPDSVQISLLESGQMVTGMTDSGPLRMRTVGPGKKNGSTSFDAEHACTMTLYRPDGPRGAGYYVRSAEITYPDSVLARADGKTSLLTARIRLQDVPDPSRINAQLRCRLPAVDGAEQRVRRFFRFGPEQLAAAGFADPDSTADQEYRRARPHSRTGPSRKALDCNDVRVCWQGDCVVNDGGTSCFGGGGGGGIGGSGTVGGLPPRNSPCTGEPCPFIYPADMGGGPTGGPEKRIPIHDYNPAVDTVKIDELPDCSLSDSQAANELGSDDLSLDEWKYYCKSSQPNSTQTQRILDAIDRIEDRGSVCAQIAQRARLYLNKDLIYLAPEANMMSGFGYAGLVVFWDDYVDRYYGDRTKEDDGWKNDGNIDSILAHEFDHVIFDDGHMQEHPRRTQHEEQCSGLSF